MADILQNANSVTSVSVLVYSGLLQYVIHIF